MQKNTSENKQYTNTFSVEMGVRSLCSVCLNIFRFHLLLQIQRLEDLLPHIKLRRNEKRCQVF